MLDLKSKSRLKFFKSPSVDLIVAPWGFGGTDNLAQEGAHSLLEKDMVKKLEAVGAKVNLIEEESIGPFQLSEETNRIKNIKAITQINSWLARQIRKSIQEKTIPITLGGDASLSIGTVSGIANTKKDVGILWLNNHLSNSSPEVTKSWNANRMAFTVLSQSNDHEDLKVLSSESPVSPIIDKNKIVQLGVSHKSAQANAGHHYFTMEDIAEHGVQKICDEAIEYLLENSKCVHIIWDVNSLDLSGVSNYSLGQLTYREAITIAREIDLKIRRNNKLLSIDIVEHCPSREAWDKRGQAAEWVTDIVANIFGENIFNCLRKY